MRYIKFVCLLFFATSTLSLGVLAANLGKVHTHEVIIGDMSFSKGEFVIKKGESIKWVNKDIVPHTVTANDNSFDSKTISPGKSWEFKPTKVGHFPYKCAFHPSMTATFSVE